MWEWCAWHKKEEGRKWIGSPASLMNINELTLYCISFWELETGYLEENAVFENLKNLNIKRAPFLESALQWKIPQLRYILEQLNQAVDIYSFVFCSAFQYILLKILHFGWGVLLTQILVSWVRRWEYVHMFITELGKKNFDLNVSFNILNLLTLY